MNRKLRCQQPERGEASWGEFRHLASLMAVAAALLLGVTGCQTQKESDFTNLNLRQSKPPTRSDVLVLREGDSLRITFPGAPNLNTVQQIRRDGRISLPLVGEFKAIGLTTSDLERQLMKLYEPQLQTKEVTVAVESSTFPIYVTGAVLRPGKIMSDRPITALEAIMEAGGFDPTKANQKAVTVTRKENGQLEHFTLNLKQVLEGGQAQPFDLKPADIIYVPERFNWF